MYIDELLYRERYFMETDKRMDGQLHDCFEPIWHTLRNWESWNYIAFFRYAIEKMFQGKEKSELLQKEILTWTKDLWIGKQQGPCGQKGVGRD